MSPDTQSRPANPSDRDLLRELRSKLEDESIQREFLNGLLQYSPLAIVICDREYRITAVNPAFEALFGFAEDEVLGRVMDDLLSTPETIAEMREITRLSAVEQKGVHREGQRKRKNGTLVDVALFATPFYAGDDPFGYMVFYHDISGKIQAEASLEEAQRVYSAILETLEDPYFEADHLGNMTYVNRAFCDSVGYENRNEIIGSNFAQLIDPGTLGDMLEQFRALYQTKQPIKRYELKYRRRDGEVLTGELSASPILQGNRAVGSRGVVRDITPRVRAEEALRAARDEAEARAAELAAINRVAVAVSRSLDLKDILQVVCVEMTRIFDARNARIGLLNPERTALEIVGFHSVDAAEESPVGAQLSLENTPASQAVVDGKVSILIEESQSRLNTRPPEDQALLPDCGSLMVVPLVTRGRVIGTVGLAARDGSRTPARNDVELAETIASQIAAAIENARLHARTGKALDIAERDLEIGRQIQSGFLPEHVPSVPGFEVAAHFQAARQVAGDFYDVFRIGDSDSFGIVLADVCDKGVGAALFMVLFRSLVRSFSEQYRQIDELGPLLHSIVTQLNNYIANTHGSSNMFATMLLGILDPAANALFYVNGGHEPPIVMDAWGQMKARLAPTGPAVGLMPDLAFDIEKVEFAPGDLLLAFTDGIPEARNQRGAHYTEERLLKQSLRAWPSAFSLSKQLEADVCTHLGETQQFDDVTLIVLRRRIADAPNVHRFSLEATLANLSLVRSFVTEAVALMGLDRELASSLELAVDEACTNVILHGYRDTDRGEITLSIEILGDRVIVQIEDTGHAFHPDWASMPDLEAGVEDRALGGWGVHIMKAMVDGLEYGTHGGVNRLTLTKLVEAAQRRT